MEREEPKPKLVHVFHGPKVDGTAMFMGANLKNLVMTLYYDGLDLVQFMDQFVVREQAFLRLIEVLVDAFDGMQEPELERDARQELFWAMHESVTQQQARLGKVRIAASMPCSSRAGVFEVDDYAAIFSFYLRCVPHLFLDESSRVECVRLEQCQADSPKRERNRWTPEPQMRTLRRTAGIFSLPSGSPAPHVWINLKRDSGELVLVAAKWPREWGEFNIELVIKDPPGRARYFAGGGSRLDQICVDPNDPRVGWRQWVHGDCVGMTLGKHQAHLPLRVTYAWPRRTFFVLITWDDRRNPELCLNNGKAGRVERCVYGLHHHEPLLEESSSTEE